MNQKQINVIALVRDTTKARSVILKFTDHTAKQEILSRKKMLKGKIIYKQEDITKQIVEPLRVSRKKFSPGAAWSVGSFVMVKPDIGTQKIYRMVD